MSVRSCFWCYRSNIPLIGSLLASLKAVYWLRSVVLGMDRFEGRRRDIPEGLFAIKHRGGRMTLRYGLAVDAGSVELMEIVSPFCTS